MKIWNINRESFNSSIEIDDLTVLKKHDLSWYHLIREVDNFFNNNSSEVKIYEDTQLINKKDWACYFIPFDAQVHLDKITSKSPLREVQDNVSEQLTYSPFFNELLDIWDELNGEMQLVNENLKKLGVSASLKEFDIKNFKSFITFEPLSKNMSPIEYKQLLLNIALNSEMDKKVLFIIELPELYTSTSQLEKFRQIVDKAINKGCSFLIVTNESSFEGSINYTYQDVIINNAVLEQMKFKVMKELPFYCSENMYKQAKSLLFSLVDNSVSMKEIKVQTGKNYGAVVTIINVLMYNLNVEFTHDLAGVEPNLKMFIESYK